MQMRDQRGGLGLPQPVKPGLEPSLIRCLRNKKPPVTSLGQQQQIIIIVKRSLNSLEPGEKTHLIYPVHCIEEKNKLHRSSSHLLYVPGPEVENIGLDWRLPEATLLVYTEMKEKRSIKNEWVFRHKLLK